MATTTTHYGFDIPQSTDLVKDGATAIATLGQDIDTAMNTALGTNKAGLVLLNTTSFSAVASQSVSSVFNATYDNYRIVYSLTSSSANDIFVRLRSGSTDATSSDYTVQVIGANSGTISSSRATNAYWFCNQIATATEFSGIYDLFNPFKAQVTSVIAQQYLSNGTTVYFNSANSRHNLANSYDGITIYSNSAPTITGSISVYGVNK